MAISARTRPTVMLVGAFEVSRPIQKRENGQPVGDVLGHDVKIDTEGGLTYATVWASDNIAMPPAGTVVAAVASVSEDARGAQLTIRRFANAADVDAVVSAAGVK